MSALQVPPSSLFAGMTIERIRQSTPAELAAWARSRRTDLGIQLEGPVCRTCGGDGVIDGGRTWCPDCRGNGVEDPHRCSRCDGLGVVRAEERPRAVTCPVCRGGAARLDGLLDRAGVPRFYQGFTWDTYERLPEASPSQIEAYTAALAIASDPRQFATHKGHSGICLSGPAGTRKTGICTPAFASLAPEVNWPRFVSWRAWLDELTKTWRSDSPVSSAEMIAGTARADLLMIDDFAGAGGIDRREFAAEAAWKLLEARQSMEGTLLVTTNRTLQEITASYGEPAASRLAAACLWMDVEGADERRRAA